MAAPQGVARLCHTPYKFRMVLQPIIEPVLFAFEPDEHARGFTVAGNHDFVGFGQAQES